MSNIEIIIVEDEAITAIDIQEYLQKLGYSVLAIAHSGEEAILQVKKKKPHLILMDIVLEGSMDGTQAAKKIWDDYKIPIIFITAYSDEETFSRAKLSFPYAYLIKPFETRDLRIAIELALFKFEMDMKLASWGPVGSTEGKPV